MSIFITYFLFMLPPLIFMIWAQARVSSAYNKYSRVRNMSGLTGVQAAQTLLEHSGLRDVKIEGTKGKLTDHYDPRHKALRLSADVARIPSVAALGIVAHEVGHAIQHKMGYAPLKLRSALIPAASLGSRLGFICVILGIILLAFNVAFGETLAWVGVYLFGAAVLFALPPDINCGTFSKEEGEIDWRLPAVDIWRRVRAFNPWPGCHTRWRGKSLKIIEAVPLDEEKTSKAGQVVALTKDGFGVGTGDGVLGILKVQLEGKRAMSAAEFLRGQREFIGAVLPLP